MERNKLSKIKLNGRDNKFVNNQNINNITSNVSNISSARAKESESKDSKKNIRVIKQEYILKSGEGKLRFSKEVKDKIMTRPNLLTKNPLKVLNKISPKHQHPAAENNFSIPIDRVSQYNNFWKLSGRTKQSK